MKASKMIIFMIIVSATFHLALTAMNSPSANNVRVVGQEYATSNVTFDQPNPVFGFLGPLMIVWNTFVGFLKFLDAPYQFLNAIGAPYEVKLLIGLPWRLAWIFAVISFVRGYES